MSVKYILEANKFYRAKNYVLAHEFYLKAATIYGKKLFRANIDFCKKRISKINIEVDVKNFDESNFFELSVLSKLDQRDWCDLVISIGNNFLDKKIFFFDNAIKEESCVNLKPLTLDDYLSECDLDSRNINIIQAEVFLIFYSAAKNKNKISLGLIANKAQSSVNLKKIFAKEFINLAAFYKEKRDTDAVYTLTQQAYLFNSSETYARAIFWAALGANDLKSARCVLDKIIQLGSKRKSSDEWLTDAEKKLSDAGISFDDIFLRLNTRAVCTYPRDKKRIAYFLHNSLPYSSGGYATRAHGLATGLTQLGYEVLCITRPGFPYDTEGDHSGKDLPACDIVDGIEYIRIFNPPRRNNAKYILNAADAMKEILKKREVSVVIAASNYLTGIPAGIAARELGIPYFYEVRGFWEVTRASREPEYAFTQGYADQVESERIAAAYADAVFTLTTPMKEELIHRGVARHNITLLPNSCDPTKFIPRKRDTELAAKLKIPENVPVIGYIGSFVQYEGLDNLAQACALLLKSGTDFRLLLVGNENASGSERGPITEEIIRVAEQEGLAEKLIMPGRVPHEQVEAYYSLIDIAPFPRKPQPVTEMVSPMKPLEALAMEKAVLVSSVRALTEMIIDGETGIVFEKGNIFDFAEKLQRMIYDLELRSKLGKAGRSWVENERTWKKTALIAGDVLSKSLQSM